LIAESPLEILPVHSSFIPVTFLEPVRCLTSEIAIKDQYGEKMCTITRYCAATSIEELQEQETISGLVVDGELVKNPDEEQSNYLIIWKDLLGQVQVPYVATLKRRYLKTAPQCDATLSGSQRRCKNGTHDPSGRCWRHRSTVSEK
jgi:hypothetical protein